MKKLLFLAGCCLLLTGCFNSEKSSGEVERSGALGNNQTLTIYLSGVKAMSYRVAQYEETEVLYIISTNHAIITHVNYYQQDLVLKDYFYGNGNINYSITETR